MKAVVFHDIGDIRLEDVEAPLLQEPGDAIVRLTASAICGTDLHFVRGTIGGMRRGTILGHEGVGVVEEIGADVRNLSPGDRVVIGSTIGCGYCSYCRSSYYSQCDHANPNGPREGTAFFGGPASSGPFNGMQAEKVRVPFASVNCVKLPDDVTDDKAILLSDIFPTGYFGAEIAQIRPGDTVAVFGCGPVGQFAIASARLMGAGRVFAIDHVPSRLDLARGQAAEVIDFEHEDPVEIVRQLTGGIGCDRAIDAVGVDAEMPRGGPARPEPASRRAFREEQERIAPKAHPKGSLWRPGDAPSQALSWSVRALAKAGTLAIIGVYSDASRTFPIGQAVEKNLTINTGNCPHRRYLPKLIELVRTRAIDPTALITQHEPLASAVDAYKAFDQRKAGWLKVVLQPEAARTE